MTPVIGTLTLFGVACLAWMLSESLLGGNFRPEPEASDATATSKLAIPVTLDPDNDIAPDELLRQLSDLGFAPLIGPDNGHSVVLRLTSAQCHIAAIRREGLYDADCGPPTIPWNPEAADFDDLLLALALAAIGHDNIRTATSCGLIDSIASKLRLTELGVIWQTHLALCRGDPRTLNAAYLGLKTRIPFASPHWQGASLYQEAVLSLAAAATPHHPAAAYRGLDALRRLRMIVRAQDLPLDQIDTGLRLHCAGALSQNCHPGRGPGSPSAAAPVGPLKKRWRGDIIPRAGVTRRVG